MNCSKPRLFCLVIITLLIAYGSQLQAQHGTLSGCVTDESGNPVPKVKVWAIQDSVPTSVGGAAAGVATTDENGCYKMKLLPYRYLVSILAKDSYYKQGQIPITPGGEAHLDLTTAPHPKLLRQRVADALNAAASGFAGERSPELQTGYSRSLLRARGSALVAKFIPGFDTCILGYLTKPDGTAAVEWCLLPRTRKAELAEEKFRKTKDVIAATISDLPELGYGAPVEVTAACSDCTREVQWLSNSNGAVFLRIRYRAQYYFDSRLGYSVEFWVVYDRGAIAASCTSTAPPSPAVYEADATMVMEEQIRAVKAEHKRMLTSALTAGLTAGLNAGLSGGTGGVNTFLNPSPVFDRTYGPNATPLPVPWSTTPPCRTKAEAPATPSSPAEQLKPTGPLQKVGPAVPVPPKTQ